MPVTLRRSSRPLESKVPPASVFAPAHLLVTLSWRSALYQTRGQISLWQDWDFVKQLGEFRENLIKSTMNPRAADGKVIRSAGTLPVVLELGDERIQETVHILPGVRGILLSWDVTKRLRLIPTDFPRQMPSNNPRRYAPSGPEDGLLSYSRTPVPLPDRGTTARSCATMTPPGGQGSSCSPPMPSVGREDGEMAIGRLRKIQQQGTARRPSTAGRHLW